MSNCVDPRMLASILTPFSKYFFRNSGLWWIGFRSSFYEEKNISNYTNISSFSEESNRLSVSLSLDPWKQIMMMKKALFVNVVFPPKLSFSGNWLKLTTRSNIETLRIWWCRHEVINLSCSPSQEIWIFLRHIPR